MVSPLARSLRGRLAGPELGGGVIPARAGFTRAHPHGHSAGQDHPRSRGVYPGEPTRLAPRCGSSPLARGLRVPHVQVQVAPGIIPARAGFTHRVCRTRCSPRDHPRSRGVYPLFTRNFVRASGSSPLARGLRATGQPVAADNRIIPARARFTHFSELHYFWDEDHPRSRGVYTTTIRKDAP